MNKNANKGEKKPLLDPESSHANNLSINTGDNAKGSEKSRLDTYMDSFSDKKKVVLGTLMSIFAGIMYGMHQTQSSIHEI